VRDLKGKVRTLNYRTIRYPGHAAIMKALLNDLGLRHRREVLKDILENALPATLQDVVVIFVTVSGRKNGRLLQETYANKIYSRQIGGRCAAPSRSPRHPASAPCSTCWPTARCRSRASSARKTSRLDAFLANRFGPPSGASSTKSMPSGSRVPSASMTHQPNRATP
jgi:hypothetical protein